MATIINLDRYGLHRLAHEGNFINGLVISGKSQIFCAFHFTGNGKMVEFLIQKGADVNAADKSGVTPLHAAASLGKHDELI